LGEDADKTVLIRRKPESMPRVEPKIDMPPRLDDACLQILNGKSAGQELALVKESAKLSKAGDEIVHINKRPDGHFIVYLDQSAKESAPRINGQHLSCVW